MNFADMAHVYGNEFTPLLKLVYFSSATVTNIVVGHIESTHMSPLDRGLSEPDYESGVVKRCVSSFWIALISSL